MHLSIVARAILVCTVFLTCFGVFASSAATVEEVTPASILADYERMKPAVVTLTNEIRDARKTGGASVSGRTLETRKKIGDFVKTLRRFDKEQLRASKGAKTYPERSTILKLFHACDVMLRLIDAETKSADFQMLGLKYEEMWKQANASLKGNPQAEEAQQGIQEEPPER